MEQDLIDAGIDEQSLDQFLIQINVAPEDIQAFKECAAINNKKYRTSKQVNDALDREARIAQMRAGIMKIGPM